MNKTENSVRVELMALDASGAETSWSATAVLFPTGTVVRVGTRPDADIALPPQRFGAIARLHFGIAFVKGQTILELYHPEVPASLDGRPANGARLDAKPHELTIGNYRFRVTAGPA